MPRLCTFLFLLASMLAASQAGWAQQTGPVISGDFRNLRFEQFAQRVEAQTPYRFFFNPATVDTVTVQVQASSLTLPALLKQVFAHSSLQFAVDEATHRVFITQG